MGVRQMPYQKGNGKPQYAGMGIGGSGSGGGSTYVLPKASADTLGGIKVGTRLSINSDGVLSASDQSYTLPTASSDTLGGVKVGPGLSITDGVLSATHRLIKTVSGDGEKTYSQVISEMWSDFNSLTDSEKMTAYLVLVNNTGNYIYNVAGIRSNAVSFIYEDIFSSNDQKIITILVKNASSDFMFCTITSNGVTISNAANETMASTEHIMLYV